jgi:hypothetical protein
MSRILKVSGGDYRISVQGPLNPSTGIPSAGGNIILDTITNGSAYGKVTVLGTLDIQGTLTYIESTNTQIKDNIIQLNYGESGAGITAGTSGIEIERGTLSAARIVFDESVQHYNVATNAEVNGTFSLRTADGVLSGLQVSALVNDGTHDFIFDLQNTTTVLRVVNANGGYENNVNNDNDLLNRKFLYNYVAATGGIADVTNIHYPISYTGLAGSSQVSAGVAGITVTVGTTVAATITSVGTTLGKVLINTNTITGTDAAAPLVLTSNNNNIEIQSVLNLDNQVATPSYTSGMTKLYSNSSVGTPTPGRTGLYIVNPQQQTSDELISRNRAVLLSILL